MNALMVCIAILLASLATTASAGLFDSWITYDPVAENAVFEKQYGTLEHLSQMIGAQKERTQSLIKDRESLRRENHLSLQGRPFRDNSDRQYWSDRFRESADAIRQSQREERRLQGNYDKWTRAQRQPLTKSANQSTNDVCTVESSHGVSFTPLFVPLSIGFDSKNGLTLTCSGKMPTPIGVFEIYKNVSFPDRKTLIIVLGDKKHVYDLHGGVFKISLPNDLEGKSKIESDEQGNIVVVVPHPVAISDK